MSKKILKPFKSIGKGLAGGLFSKKKKAAPAAQERDGKPIITQLGADAPGSDFKKLMRGRGVGRMVGTILGGDNGTLGG